MTFSPNFLNNSAGLFFTVLICLSGCRSTTAPVPIRVHDFSTASVSGPIAVLPVYNLSGTPAPLTGIHQLIRAGLNRHGIETLDANILDPFMARHRIRYTGGLNRENAVYFREELGVQAVMIISLELFSDRSPPKAALTSRLISTSSPPTIVWMDGIGLAGDDTVGLLGLSLIQNSDDLLKKTAEYLTVSLADHLSADNGQTKTIRKKKTFRPQALYRSPVISSSIKYRVAVMPFFNISDRKYAGEILALHFVNHLSVLENVEVIEPGIVRQSILETRVIMMDGLSLANTDVIFSRLGADLILTGRVIDYQDYQGATGKPIVDFSTELIERKSREVAWKIKTYHQGDESVWFFDWGKINTAYLLASEMVRDAVGMIFQ